MKKLSRNKNNRVLFGVCSGLGEYLDIDPVIIRIIFIFLLFYGGAGFLAYIIAIFIIPEKNDYNDVSDNTINVELKNEKDEKDVNDEKKKKRDNNGNIVGIILVFIGLLFLMRNFSIFDDLYLSLIHFVQDFFWPALFIGLGAFIIYKNK